MADEADDNTENNGKGGKTKLIIIIAVVLVLLIGGGVAFFLLGGDDESTEEVVDSVALNADLGASAAGPALYLSLDPAFVVDFNIKGKQRYLQLDLTIQSRSKEQVDAVKIHMPLIRNSLVLLFSSQDFSELQTAEGKQKLKTDAINAINAILRQETGVEGVESVLFTNFVMQ